MIASMNDPEFEIYEKRLQEAFDPADLEFNAILARLSVLFEDLLVALELSCGAERAHPRQLHNHGKIRSSFARLPAAASQSGGRVA